MSGLLWKLCNSSAVSIDHLGGIVQISPALCFRYFLPYMMSNIRSISSSQGVYKSMVGRQVEKVFKAASCSSKRAHQQRLKGMTVRTWREASLHPRIPETRRKSNSSLRANFDQRDEAVNEVQTDTPSRCGENETLMSLQEPELLNLNLKSSIAIDTRRALWFLSCKVALPAERRRMLINPKAQEESISAARSAVENMGDDDVQMLRLFQARIKAGYQRRAELRQAEFSAWLLEGNPRQGPGRQHVLSAITFAFVAILSAFTLGICLLLSLAFTSEECLLWVVGVGKSLLMQLLVTEPLVGLVVLSLKFAGSWGLVSANRAHRRELQQRDWKRREQFLILRERCARNELQALLNQEEAVSATVDQHSGVQTQRPDFDLRRARSSSLQHRLHLIELERSILAAERQALLDGGSRAAASSDGTAMHHKISVKQAAIVPLNSVTTRKHINTIPLPNDLPESQKCMQPDNQLQFTDLDDNTTVVFDEVTGLDGAAVVDSGASDGASAAARNRDTKFMPERESEVGHSLKRMPSAKMLFGTTGFSRRLMRRARNVKLITPAFYNNPRAPTHSEGSRRSTIVHQSNAQWSVNSNRRGQKQKPNTTSADSASGSFSSMQLPNESGEMTPRHVGVSERTFVHM